MTVDYNNFAKTFSNSRKNMKWEEIDYFLSFLSWEKNIKILDIWCWNGRFFWELINKKIDFKKYLWIDLSYWLLEEANKIYKNFIDEKSIFLELNMTDLNKIENLTKEKKFDYIFLIASFHHLNEIKDRKKVMKNLYKILKKSWKIFMTNWALDSELNNKKYFKSKIEKSKNNFWSIDYKIKIGEFNRFYHCFSLEELDYLAWNSWFKIIENKLFKNKKNYITILEK